MNLLYIDPGTGSMLFAILLGFISAAMWAIKGLLVKIRFFFSGGKREENESGGQPLVIFSDDKRYWSVFEPVCRELNERGFETTYLTASPDDPALECTYEHIHPEFIGKGNKAFVKLNFLRADVVFSTTPGLDVYQWKRSKDVKYYVHMLHAPAEVTGYRMFGLDYYDAVLLSGDYQFEDERNLEKIRNLPEKELVMVGIPYMDEMAKRLKENPPTPSEQKTVMLAPSWGPSAIFSRYGGKILDVLLESDYHIIVRPHPQSFASETELINGLMEKYPDSDRLEWNRDADNFEVLKRSDILISDFSGVIFDFSLVYDKPIIYADTDFDNSPYDSCWLDTPFWTFTALPRIGEKLTPDRLEQLPQLISDCLSEQRYADGRREVRDETWCYRGEGASRVADYLIAKCIELAKDEMNKTIESAKDETNKTETEEKEEV